MMTDIATSEAMGLNCLYPILIDVIIIDLFALLMQEETQLGAIQYQLRAINFHAYHKNQTDLKNISNFDLSV